MNTIATHPQAKGSLDPARFKTSSLDVAQLKSENSGDVAVIGNQQTPPPIYSRWSKESTALARELEQKVELENRGKATGLVAGLAAAAATAAATIPMSTVAPLLLPALGVAAAGGASLYGGVSFLAGLSGGTGMSASELMPNIGPVTLAGMGTAASVSLALLPGGSLALAASAGLSVAAGIGVGAVAKRASRAVQRLFDKAKSAN